MLLYTDLIKSIEGLDLVQSPAFLSLHYIGPISSLVKDILDKLFRLSILFKFTIEKMRSQLAFEIGMASNACVNFERIVIIAALFPIFNS